MINFQRNNLDKASSPYLQQHKDNPIFWQEWSKEILDYAKENNKIIFVSVGYSTCHWCHVMAQESFSNQEVANFLNKNFVSVKVDREQRPDIDQYLMSFIVETQGHGGWPLNVFITHDLKPILALTYAPLQQKYGMPSLMNILDFVKKTYKKNKDDIKPYSIKIIKYEEKENIEEKHLINIILSNFDQINYGFGHQPKFPPHCTLLFLLHYYEYSKNQKIKDIIEKTLDKIAISGLHDHLQGGFFRYCVDSQWVIPHFEKMLYDQAMLLWIYSLAYKIFKKEEYKLIAEKIIKCLEETFLSGENLFYSAHDADTNHEEGLTYLWTLEEIKRSLTEEEYKKFTEIYNISETGNFKGKNHLIKGGNIFLDDEAENKLLKIRNERRQPFIDKKIITSWNALAGIALLINYRFTDNEKAKYLSIGLFERLIKKHLINCKVMHSSIANKLQEHEFLEDYASLLLFTTLICEETNEHKHILDILYEKIKTFKKDNIWYENLTDDFIKVPAQYYDHPVPSSTSLAKLAVLRTRILLDEQYEVNDDYKNPLENDFYNLTVFIKHGNFHIIKTRENIQWNFLPINSMQIINKKIIQDCFANKCLIFKNKEELIKSLNRD